MSEPVTTVTLPDGTVYEVTPDEHGNSYVTFGDGTGAVHTTDGWFEVLEDE